MKSIPKTLAMTIFLMSAVLFSMITGCSDSFIKSTSSTKLKIAIDTHDTFSKQSAITFFVVVVSEPESGDILTAESLTLNGTFLEGVLDSLPADRPLQFTVQARDRSDLVIYEGSVVTSITADQLNLIEVQLRPVVPMMKLSPRSFDFTNLTQATTFFVDVKVFNIDSLFETTFRLHFDESFCTVDSVALSSELLADSVLLFHGFVDIFPPQYSVTIAPAGIFQPLVDDNGDGVLVRFFFRTVTATSRASNFSNIRLQITGMAKSDPDNTIDLNNIEVDHAFLEF